METTDPNHAGMIQAINASVRNSKRALLDFVDLQMGVQYEKADEVFWEIFKKRIHNELSTIEFQMRAACEIVRTGGIIPAFGRTDRQIADDNHRKAQAADKR